MSKFKFPDPGNAVIFLFHDGSALVGCMYEQKVMFGTANYDPDTDEWGILDMEEYEADDIIIGWIPLPKPGGDSTIRVRESLLDVYDTVKKWGY